MARAGEPGPHRGGTFSENGSSGSCKSAVYSGIVSHLSVPGPATAWAA